MNAELFASVDAYNAAFPASPMPAEPHRRNTLRGYHAAMKGVTDDVADTGTSLTIDFLPGGAPAPDELDREGTVVASRWGEAPVLVLAERVSLRAAWKAITSAWPTTLSGVTGALSDVASVPGR